MPLNDRLLQISDTEPITTVLSIVILTMNRKGEALRALQSCIECSLPPKTEFIIIDNASQDGTRENIEMYFKNNNFEYHYFYLSENIGVAAGRNVGFKQANGRYIYFLDDDAFIEGPKHSFFEEMIKFLEDNKDVFCVTTSIFDTVLKDNRFLRRSKYHQQNKYEKVLMFHGGSCLIDKQRCFDQNKLYLEQQLWGMEELYPSLKSYFKDRYVGEMKDLNVIHAPSSSARFRKEMYSLLVCTGMMHAKLTFYPLVAYPLIYIFFSIRIIKHLGFKSLVKAFTQLSRNNKKLETEPVPLSRLIKLIREFGVKATF